MTASPCGLRAGLRKLRRVGRPLVVSLASCLALVVVYAAAASVRTEGVRASGSAPAAGVTVAPRTVSLTVGQSQQFTPTDSGDGSALTWSVDGVAGGSAALGTVSASGLYVAPRRVGVHTVTAMSVAGTATGARVYVTTSPDVLTFHYDLSRTGQNVHETVLSPSTVNKTRFGKLFSYLLDGQAYATPLYVQNLAMGGSLGTRNVVFVATEHDSVYAFDADGRSETPLWKRSFINPAKGVTPVPAADTGEKEDIPNEIGITSTPVIDRVTNTIYVVAKTKEVSGGKKAYVQRLHALDIRTGLDRAKAPSVVIKASVRGKGRGSTGGRLPFSPLHQNQRMALTLANGVIYLGFGSHGDYPPFHGWLLGYKASTLRQVVVFNVTPNDDGGGIWMSGNGAGVDRSGKIYVTTSNGLYDAAKGGPNFRDSILKLSASGKVLDYFSPKNKATLDAADLDLGVGGTVLLPDQAGPHRHLLVVAGKDGNIYLVDRDKMGHFDARVNHVVQEIPKAFTKKLGYSGGNFSAPVYFNGRVYFGPVNDNVQAFSLRKGRLSTKPVSRTAASFSSRGTTFSVSAYSATDPNGIFWALQYQGSVKPGMLRAYRANNLRAELWNSNQAGNRDSLGAWTKFSQPTVANGKVYVSGIDRLTVFGLLPDVPSSP